MEMRNFCKSRKIVAEPGMLVISGLLGYAVFLFEFGFQILPIVSVFVVVVLVVQYRHDVQDRKPPFSLFFIP